MKHGTLAALDHMAKELSTALASLKIDRTAPKHGGRGWWTAGVVAALLAASGAAIAVVKPYLEALLLTTTVSTTQIVVVSPAQGSIELSAAGYARTDAVSRISPRVAGLVRAVHVKQGDRVKQHQVIFELDSARHQASIDTAVRDGQASAAAAAGARARASVAASELEELTIRAERARRLSDAGVSPSGVADDLAASVASVELRARAAEAEADAAAAQAKALHSRTRALTRALDDLVVASPISGTVIGKPPQPGEYIDPQFAPGLRIADLSQMYVEVDVPEAKLGYVRPGRPAEIVLEAYPDRRFRGEVTEVLPEVDRAKATVSVKVAFMDDKSGVLPEMSARVSFLTRAEEPAAMQERPKKVLPSAAVVDRANTKVVFVVETNRVRMVAVKLGQKSGSVFELVDGPPPGTVLVAEPPPTLTDGQRVKTNP